MNSIRKRVHGIPARLQSLEPRRLLAGNVTAVLNADDGVLVITGDNKANQFIVVAGDSDTTVTGLNGTKVNGGATALFDDFPDLVIDTGNGDDEVEVVDLIGALSVKTGNGNDRVDITEDAFFPIAFDNFDIDTGNGDDRIELWDLNTLFCDLNITMGNGDDYLRMLGSIQVLGDGTIDMGKGADTIDEKFLFDYTSTGTTVILNNETVLPPLI